MCRIRGGGGDDDDDNDNDDDDDDDDDANDAGGLPRSTCLCQRVRASNP